MKKTLALLLALLMITTISLAACKKDKTPSGLDDEDDDNFNAVTTDENESESESESDSDTKKPTTTEWVDKNDVVYAGVDRLNLRTSASASGSTNIAKKVDSGTKLNRIASNGIWSKVTLDGETTEYYVSNDWLASNGGDFSFTSCTPVDLTINESEYLLTFFESPFESDDNDLYFENTVCASGFKKENVKGTYTLKKIGTSASGSWIKVTFVGTIEISSNNVKTFSTEAPGTLYIKQSAITRGVVTDPTYVANNPSGGGRG